MTMANILYFVNSKPNHSEKNVCTVVQCISLTLFVIYAIIKRSKNAVCI